MSLERGFQLHTGGLKFVGYSLAGISTSIAFPEADVLFDVAQGLPYQTGYNTILLTHAHMDHASGLPYLISQKSMQNRPPPVIYMPKEAIEPFQRMMSIWHEIDQFEYAFEFREAKPGQLYPLKGEYAFRTFPTFHRVPSQGYNIVARKKRLKTEYKAATPHELGRLRREGLELEESYEENLISFTGDTRIEFLENDLARRAKVLFMEVTYWDEKKSVANAREWGHIHFDEFLPELGKIEAEKIVLIHASARYKTRELEQIIADRVPEHLKSKLILFARPL